MHPSRHTSFKKWKRPLFWLFALALILVFGFVLLRSNALEVTAARISIGRVETVVETRGQAELRDRLVMIAPVAGFMAGISRQAGEQVHAGEIMGALIVDCRQIPEGHLDGNSASAAASGNLDLAHQDADAARARAELATQEYERLKQASQDDAARNDNLRTGEMQMLASREQLRDAEFSIDAAAYQLETKRVREQTCGTNDKSSDTINLRYPLDGVVLANHHVDAGAVQASAELAEIGDPDSLEVVATLPTPDAGLPDSGTEVRLQAENEPPIEGIILNRESVSSRTPTSSLAPKVHILPMTAAHQSFELHDGETVRVDIITWSTSHAMRIPNAALFRQEDRWMTYVIRGNRAYARPVGIGHVGRDWCEVVDGLKEGDLVITDPPAEAHDGIRVRATLLPD